MKKLFFICALLWCTELCFAEAPAPDAWDKKHADETSVVLYTSTQVAVNSDGSYTQRSHWKKRIQNELGKDEGEISVVYNKKRDILKKLDATITTPDGKKHRYEKIQDLDIDGIGSYSDYRRKIISMPQVVVGSVIEFEMERFTSQDMIKGHHFELITHLDTVPSKEQLLSFSFPEGMPVYLKYLNTDKRPAIEHKNGRIIYRWVVHEDGDYDEAYEKEERLPPANDFMQLTSISTMKDWSEVARWVRGEFLKATIVTPEIEAEAREITEGKTSILDRVMAVKDWIHDNLRYIAMNTDEHDLTPHPASEILKNKFGDCKDQAALLIAMLSAIGIEAYPVLVCPEEVGAFWKVLPDPGMFDHVIVVVKQNGRYYFVDPQIEGYRFDEIPASLQCAYVFILDGPQGKMMQLPAVKLEDRTETIKAKTQLNPDGSVVQDSEFILAREDSISEKKRFKLATESQKKQFLEMMDNSTQGGRLVSYDFIGLDDPYGLLTVRFKMEKPHYVRPLGPFMVFGSSGVSWSSDFVDKSRKYPLWLSGESVTTKNCEYIIPAGFRVLYVPKDIDLKSPWIDVRASSQRRGRTIVLQSRVHLKKGIISPQRYEEFKKFLVKIDELSNEAILIKRSKFLTWFQGTQKWFGDIIRRVSKALYETHCKI